MSSHCLLHALFSGPNKTLLTYSSQVSSPSPLIPRQFSMTLAQTQTLRRLRPAHSPCSVGCLPHWRLFSSHLAQRLVLGPPGFTVWWWWFRDWTITIRAMAFACLPFFFFFEVWWLTDWLIDWFLAVLGLHFCARAFSSCGERGPLFIVVRGSLIVVASLVAEHKLQTRRLSSCGSRA